MANLVKSPAERITMSYARYLMSVYLKRRLEKNEQVDHINNDKLDDRIENFQILTQKENIKKSKKSKTYKNFICQICGKDFKLEARQFYKKSNPTCSRKCGGIKSRQVKREAVL